MDEITDQDVAEADALYAQWVTAIKANPVALRELTDKFYVAVRQYNALRAKLDAVPEYAYYYGEMWRQLYDSDDVPMMFTEWYTEWYTKPQAVQP